MYVGASTRFCLGVRKAFLKEPGRRHETPKCRNTVNVAPFRPSFLFWVETQWMSHQLAQASLFGWKHSGCRTISPKLPFLGGNSKCRTISPKLPFFGWKHSGCRTSSPKLPFLGGNTVDVAPARPSFPFWVETQWMSHQLAQASLFGWKHSGCRTSSPKLPFLGGNTVDVAPASPSFPFLGGNTVDVAPARPSFPFWVETVNVAPSRPSFPFLGGNTVDVAPARPSFPFWVETQWMSHQLAQASLFGWKHSGCRTS